MSCQVLQVAVLGAKQGCAEALFTLGKSLHCSQHPENWAEPCLESEPCFDAALPLLLSN